MRYIIETERLGLRYFMIDDTPFIISLLNSPGWIEFIGDRNVRTEEQAQDYLLNGPMKSYKENGYGLCMVETRNDRTPIGMCGIINRVDLEGPDIGFAILPEYTGKGYAYEIAAATMNYATDILKIPEVFAITLPANKTSIKLLEKIGLSFQKIFSFPDKQEELMLYKKSHR